MAVVLAVDDRPEMLRSIGAVLESEHSCILASRSSDALGVYLRNRPALVLLDLMMPGVEGDEVAARILEADPAARIVVFSVVESVKRIVRLFGLGIRDYLVKPCEGARLREVVNENLSEPGAEALVVTATTSRIRSRLREAFRAGRVPVLVGPKGIGKRTEMLATLGEAGVSSPVVAGPLPSRDPGGWLREGFRMGGSGPAGLVVWGTEETWTRLGPEGVRDRLETARRAFKAEGCHLGVTWDVPADGPGVIPPFAKPFEILHFPGLHERKDELASILEQFRNRVDRSPGREAWASEAWLPRAIAKHPFLGTMRMIGALARESELRRHLRERAGIE